MKIGNFDLEKDGTFIIAELSANHSGSLQLALDTIKAAKEAGANAIKLQTYTPEWMTIDSKRDDFIIKGGTLWDGKNYFELYKEAMTPLKWHKELFEYARSLDLEVFSSPFSKEAVDFLEQFDPVAYKIASFEITDYELVRYTAKKNKPIIISTGIASIEDIYNVVQICKDEGNEQIILLKCTSSYPASLKEANLLTIPNLKETFGVEVGFSDHTLGNTAAIVATTLGAKVIEKHFILDKSIDSPDKKFSLDPNEFSQMVKAIRDTQDLLGKVSYTPKKGKSFARSLYIVKDIEAGDVFTNENVKSIRPGYGLHPKYLPQILGKKAKCNLSKGDRMKMEYVEC
jgi:pseudaminic acid synthase